MPQFTNKVNYLEKYMLAFFLLSSDKIKISQLERIGGRCQMKRNRWEPNDSPVSLWESESLPDLSSWLVSADWVPLIASTAVGWPVPLDLVQPSPSPVCGVTPPSTCFPLIRQFRMHGPHISKRTMATC